MQNSSNSCNEGATSVMLPLLLCSLGINALQHPWSSNQMVSMGGRKFNKGKVFILVSNTRT